MLLEAVGSRCSPSTWPIYSHEELVQRDKCSLDIFWLRDVSQDSENLPPPDAIAAEIVEDLRAALEQFAEIKADLTRNQWLCAFSSADQIEAAAKIRVRLTGANRCNLSPY